MSEPLFSLSGLCVDVPGRRLIHDLDLDLPQGQVIALIGHNGSGKSTLLKVLARQVAPSAGRVAFEGRAVAARSARDHARALAFLPQTTPPAEGMTVRELVALLDGGGAGGHPGRTGPAQVVVGEQAGGRGAHEGIAGTGGVHHLDPLALPVPGPAG